MYTFATLNMGNYPPPNTQLKAACDAMIAAENPMSALKNFMLNYAQGYLNMQNLHI